MKKALRLLFALLPLACASAGEVRTIAATPDRGGSIRIGGAMPVAFSPAFYEPGWTYRAATGAAAMADGGSGWRMFAIETAGGDNTAAGRLRFDGRVRFRETGDNGEERLVVDFPDGPVRILVQENRTWGNPVALLRFFFAEERVEGGREYALRAKVSAPGTAFELREPVPVRIEAGEDWIPCPAPPAGEDWIEPGSALDFSGIAPRHVPAGAFGRVIAAGDHFELEDRPGEPFRLCGANLCYGANFPATPDAAQRFARNYARLGYNAIRIHHHDGAWAKASAMRAAGSRRPAGDAPLSNISSWYNPAQYLLARGKFDYVDDHGYVDHPRFPEKAWRLPATCDGLNPLVGGDGALSVTRRRLFGKPFVATEWNWCAPNPHRTASGLVTGALAARQDWAGLWRFAWSHFREGCEAR